MDPKKIDDVITKLMSMPKDKLADSLDEFALAEADKEACEFGIERLTLLNTNDHKILLIKPNELMKFWQLNLFSFGSFQIKGEPDISLVSLTGEFYRMRVVTGELTYWVDLKNEFQLDKASKFLGIEIENALTE